MTEVFAILFYFQVTSLIPLDEIKNKQIGVLPRQLEQTCSKLYPFKKIPTPWIKIDKNSN